MHINLTIVFRPFGAVAYIPFLRSLVSQTPVFSFGFVDLMVWLFAGWLANPSEKVGTGEGGVFRRRRPKDRCDRCVKRNAAHGFAR